MHSVFVCLVSPVIPGVAEGSEADDDDNKPTHVIVRRRIDSSLVGNHIDCQTTQHIISNQKYSCGAVEAWPFSSEHVSCARSLSPCSPAVKDAFMSC